MESNVIGNRIRKIRTERNLSLQQFANKLSVSKSLISKYENGHRKPGRDVLALISEQFNVSLDYLLGITNEITPTIVNSSENLSGIGANMFYKQLRELRKKHNLTQEELSTSLKNKFNVNISTSAIGMYEQNRRQPDHDNLVLFSKFFDVSVDYLLGREDNHHATKKKQNNHTGNEKKILNALYEAGYLEKGKELPPEELEATINMLKSFMKIAKGNKDK